MEDEKHQPITFKMGAAAGSLGGHGFLPVHNRPDLNQNQIDSQIQFKALAILDQSFSLIKIR